VTLSGEQLKTGLRRLYFKEQEKLVRLVLTIFLLLFPFLLTGCGGATSDSGFPAQQPVSPTQGFVSGTVQFPNLVNLNNLNSLSRVSKSLSGLSEARKALSQVTDFRGFVVIATVGAGSGNITTITGSIEPNGVYFVQGIPFGEEVTIEVKKGKIALKAIVPPISAQSASRDQAVNVLSTAEALLYEEVKKRDAFTSFEAQQQSASFRAEREKLASLLENEIKNENVDETTPPLLQRTVVRSNVEVVGGQVSQGATANHLPFAVIDSLSQTQRGKIQLTIRLFDAENDPVDIALFYSEDGTNFTSATIGTGSAVLNNLATSRQAGVSYNLFWESAADLGVGIQASIRLALDVYPAGAVRTLANRNRATTVALNVDNRGLPEIVSVSDSQHLIGTTKTVTVQGGNLSVVTQVALEYLGNENFVSPRSYIFQPSQFNIVNDQNLNFVLPAYGLFPVPYNIVLKGQIAGDTSVSSQQVQVLETAAPDFTNILVNLNPTSGSNHEQQTISFRGRNIMGAFGNRVNIQPQAGGARIPLTPISASLVSTNPNNANYSLVEWRGTVPERIATGAYRILVKNSCTANPACQIEVEAADNGVTTVFYTVSEDAPIISSVLPEFGVGINSQDNRISVFGERLSSTFEVRISTSFSALENLFSLQKTLPISSTSFEKVDVTFPLGEAPGTYFMAVRNLGGITISNQSFTVREGPIPENVTITMLDQASQVIPSKTINNISTFRLRIDGTSLSSLNKVRLLNKDIPSVILALNPSFQSFSQAFVDVAMYNPPGDYGLELINAAGITTVTCPSGRCFSVTEAFPVVQDFENSIRPQDLQPREIIAGESGVFRITGQNLAGSTKARICRNPGNCQYNIPSVTGSFFEVIANVSSSEYMRPGTYFLELDNLTGTGVTSITSFLTVLERQPVLDAVNPNTLSSRQLLEQANSIQFSGRNLFGVRKIYLVPKTGTQSVCSKDPTTGSYLFEGSEIEGIGRNQVNLNLANNSQIVPGEYVWRLQNLTPTGTDDITFCSEDLHSFTVTEPEFEFIAFSDSATKLTTISALKTAPLTVVGKFLYGLDQVELRRRFEVFTLDTNFPLQITTTQLNSASLTVPASLIPGTYDLYMKNGGMPNILPSGGSVDVIEVDTPVINSVTLVGSNQLNTNDVFFDVKGQNLEGVPLITKNVRLVDTRDGSHVVPVPASGIELLALPDQSTYVRLKVPSGTLGGNYYIQMTNGALKTTSLTAVSIVTVLEPKPVFQSVSIIGPFDTEFGFGENNKKTRLEFKGTNLASGDEIVLTREPAFTGDSSETLVRTTNIITRNFGSDSVSLVTTLPTFLRPGFYDVQIRNNSNEYSDKIDPIVSPFFQQVNVREGAPQIDFVGCTDFTGAAASCLTSASTRDVQSLQDLEMAGQNFFTLSKVEIFKEDSRTPEYVFNVPRFGESLAGSGVTTRTSRAVGVDLPEFLSHIGLYDVELTNGVSRIRFRDKLKAIENFKAEIISLTPNSIINNVNNNIAMSGNYLTGTTWVALMSSDFTTTIKSLSFVRDTNDPYHKLSFTVPENISPGNYKIKVNNSLGFNAVPPTNSLTITEPPPSITSISVSDASNVSTATLSIWGDGFLGLSEVKLKPSVQGAGGTSNGNFSINYSDISLDYTVTSRTLMTVKVPAQQLPGYYFFSMKNTNPQSFNGSSLFHIREETPVIEFISPDFTLYSNDESIKVSGANFLGVRNTVSSSTYARIKHIDSGVSRDLTFQTDPSFNELNLDVPRNLLIGLYELQVKNQVGITSSLTVTRFEIREGLAEITNATTTTLAYNADFNVTANRISVFGKHLQGVNKIELTTTIPGCVPQINPTCEYSYIVDHTLGTPDPYISISNMPISTTFMVPGHYFLRVTNSAGVTTTTSPAFQVTIPPSSITDFTPKTGPYNAPTEITFTGTNLRRFEKLLFERAVPQGDADDSIDVLSITTNQPDPLFFQEISNTQFKVRLISQNNGKFNEAFNRFFKIKWKTYGDTALRTLALVPGPSEFSLVGNNPEITSFEGPGAATLPTTDAYTDFASVNAQIATTLVNSLPQTITIKGNNFNSIQKVKLVKDSVEWTLACTTGTGSTALNGGNLTSMSMTVPRVIFQFPKNSGGNPCFNDTNLLPLQPGVYTVVLEGVQGNSSALANDAKIYFGEGLPNNTSLINPQTFFNDSDHTIQVQANNYLGVRSVTLLNSNILNPVQKTFAVDKSDIVSGYFTFDLPKGSFRGIKNVNAFGGFYKLRVTNSRGVTSQGTGELDLRERAPDVDSISKTSGKNLSSHTVVFEGQHLLGVGQSWSEAAIAVNRVKMINKEARDSAAISTYIVDITNSVSNQDRLSFTAMVPSKIRPGQYFFSVENDHHVSSANPVEFPSIRFESLDSAPVVTTVTPLFSTFDTLPTSMWMGGINLAGLSSAKLSLLSTITQNEVNLSLWSSPDLTSADFDSARFTLPQSPTFLIPGTYQIQVTNGTGDYVLPNFRLEVSEKAPFINQVNPVSNSVFSNANIVTFNILGDNLFGFPTAKVAFQSTTVTLNLTGVIQSKESLVGMTMPHSLFPDTWTLSIENSKGSTSWQVVITEPIPEVDQYVPANVPFDDRTMITISGDHFIGVSSAPGNILLTDELQTPLESIELVDRRTLKAFVPEGVNVGKFGVSVRNKTGWNTTSALLTVDGGNLAINAIAPSSGRQAGGEYIVITGTGYVEGTRLVIGNVLAQDILVFPDRIEAFVPPASNSVDLSSGSTLVNVEVINPNGAKVILPNSFTYIADSVGAPRVLKVIPGHVTGNGPADQFTNSAIAVEFDQPMDVATLLANLPGSFTRRGLTVLSNNTFLGGTLTWSMDQRVFVFSTPGNPFIPNAPVHIGFASSVQSLNGQSLVSTDVIQLDSPFFEESYVEDWRFVVGNTLDTNNLSVTAPTGQASLAPSTWTTRIVFNKAINHLTVTTSDVILTEQSTSKRIAVTLAIAPDGLSVWVDPQERLRPKQNYTMRWKDDRLESLTGRKMSSDFVYLIGSEQTGPKLLSLEPTPGSSNVARNAVIIAEFDQAIASESVNESNFFVVDDQGTRLTGTFSSSDDKRYYTYNLFDLLESSKVYNIQIKNRLKSLTGVPLTQESSSSFQVTSSDTIDLAGAVVTEVIPGNLATGVSTDASVIVSFNEPIQRSDITKPNFSLKRFISETNQLDIPYNILVNSDASVVTLDPTTALEHEKDYRVMVASGLKDLANNLSSNSVTVTFKVTPQFDLLGPGVSSIDPANGEQNVPISKQIVIRFNEPVLGVDATDSAKISLLTTTGSQITASYTQEDNGVQVRMVPTVSLEKQTEYIIRIDSTVRDIFSNEIGAVTTATFRTDDFVDSTPPVITLLTVNGIPSPLNGGGGSLLNNEGSFQTPAIFVPENGFTIDIYYNDPGTGGESSGVDLNAIQVIDEKQVFDSSANQTYTNANLFGLNVLPEHQNGHSRITIPGDWQFAAGVHTLTARVKDLSQNGNLSNEVNYSFQVAPIAGQEANYPFEGASPTQISLDYGGDSFDILGGVQQGNLRLTTLFVSNGAIDFEEELFHLGFRSTDAEFGPVREAQTPTPAVIGIEVTKMLKTRILEEVRRFFDLDPVTGLPISGQPPVNLRIDNDLPSNQNTVTRISLGGDNGAEPLGGVGVIKSIERSIYNTANGQPFLELTTRSATVDQGYGVFTVQLIRQYANDTFGFAEWNSRFSAISRLAYTNTGGVKGSPIGSFREDANVYSMEPSAAGTIPVEFHRNRYFEMRRAIDSYARIVAMSAARAIAIAVGLVPPGFPPDGLYSGSQNLPEYFDASNSTHPYLSINGENNLMKKQIPLNDVFAPAPADLKFSNFSKTYLRNQIRILR